MEAVSFTIAQHILNITHRIWEEMILSLTFKKKIGTPKKDLQDRKSVV